jgi:hypothetical protein
MLGCSQEEFRKLQEEIGRYQEKVKDLKAHPDGKLEEWEVGA